MSLSPQKVRANDRIRAAQIRLIGAEGEQFGIVTPQEGLLKAQEAGLDLVEVAGATVPPVCRIMDLGKYLYTLGKKEKESRKKQKTIDIKEVKMTTKIDEHDYQTKLRRGEQFLDKGNKLKVQLQFRGREMAHKDLGEAVMRRVRDDLSGMAVVEMAAKQVGKSINMTLSPLPAAKRKRRFSLAEHDVEDLEDDSQVEHVE